MTQILDGVIFTADFSGEWESEKHPRDAHGHFMQSTAGSGELRALLQAAPTDLLARSAAADHLEESGRQQEADLLRHSKHPLVAIGGGVFEMPGQHDAISDRSLLVLAHRPTRIARVRRQSGVFSYEELPGNHRALLFADGHAHAVHVPEGEWLEPQGVGIRPTNRLDWPRDDLSPRRRLHGRNAEVNALLARLMDHQMTGEKGDLLTLSPRAEKILGGYIKQHGPSLHGVDESQHAVSRVAFDPEMAVSPVVPAQALARHVGERIDRNSVASAFDPLNADNQADLLYHPAQLSRPERKRRNQNDLTTRSANVMRAMEMAGVPPRIAQGRDAYNAVVHYLNRMGCQDQGSAITFPSQHLKDAILAKLPEIVAKFRPS